MQNPSKTDNITGVKGKKVLQSKRSSTISMRVQQIGSIIGQTIRQTACVKGLGLRRIGHIVEVEDTPSTRGLANKVRHLVKIL